MHWTHSLGLQNLAGKMASRHLSTKRAISRSNTYSLFIFSSYRGSTRDGLKLDGLRGDAVSTVVHWKPKYGTVEEAHFNVASY